jgi:hypothetical protein
MDIELAKGRGISYLPLEAHVIQKLSIDRRFDERSDHGNDQCTARQQ